MQANDKKVISCRFESLGEKKSFRLNPSRHDKSSMDIVKYTAVTSDQNNLGHTLILSYDVNFYRTLFGNCVMLLLMAEAIVNLLLG